MTKTEIYLQVRNILSQALQLEENETVLFGDTEQGYYFRSWTPNGKILIQVDKQSGDVFTKQGDNEIYNFSGIVLKLNVTFENVLVH